MAGGTPTTDGQAPAVSASTWLGARLWRTLRAWWNDLPGRRRRWYINIALGIGIELVLVLLLSVRFWPLVRLQDWGVDAATRIVQRYCAALGPDSGAAERGGQALRCPGTDPGRPPPILVDVDDETWRNPLWGGGEPVRAPRDGVASLIERSFVLGARQVVLDILVEDSGAQGAGGPRALNDEDRAFASRLQALLGSPVGLREGRMLVLVRSERRPLPGEPDAFLGELRRSAAVDPVVQGSRGRIALAAPYFQRAGDGVVRDWQLYRASCERIADRPEEGRVRVVPSVQLLSVAQSAAIARNSPRRLEAVSAPQLSSTRCKPFPVQGPSALSGSEAKARSCWLAVALHGPSQRESAPCRGLAEACSPPAAAAGCADWAALDLPAAGPAPAHGAGLLDQYWSDVQWALSPASALPPGRPAPDALDHRIVFRHSPQSVERHSAMTIGLSGPLPKGLDTRFRDRVVVIGQTHEAAGDVFDTPLGRMPGALIVVNAIDSLALHGTLKPPPGWFAHGLAGLLIVAAGYVFARLRSLAATWVATLLVVGIAGVAGTLYFAHGVWLNFVLPLLGVQLHRMWAGHEERERLGHFESAHKAAGHRKSSTGETA